METAPADAPEKKPVFAWDIWAVTEALVDLPQPDVYAILAKDKWPNMVPLGMEVVAGGAPRLPPAHVLMGFDWRWAMAQIDASVPTPFPGAPVTVTQYLLARHVVFGSWLVAMTARFSPLLCRWPFHVAREYVVGLVHTLRARTGLALALPEEPAIPCPERVSWDWFFAVADAIKAETTAALAKPEENYEVVRDTWILHIATEGIKCVGIACTEHYSLALSRLFEGLGLQTELIGQVLAEAGARAGQCRDIPDPDKFLHEFLQICGKFMKKVERLVAVSAASDRSDESKTQLLMDLQRAIRYTFLEMTKENFAANFHAGIRELSKISGGLAACGMLECKKAVDLFVKEIGDLHTRSSVSLEDKVKDLSV